MLAYNDSLGKPNTVPLLRNPARGISPSINRGNVSVAAERQHFSTIVYAIPVERVRPLLPNSFCAQEAIVKGRAMTWVSVESFFDRSVPGQPTFEQTEYLLHVIHDSQPARFLLGTSLGSLSAVGIRNLWQMPWHLSAMEFRVAYDRTKGQYREYSLLSQSQWANANWKIGDTGQAVDLDNLGQIVPPDLLFRQDSTTFFARRDGGIGSRRTVRFDVEMTLGELKHAQCDLLERLGLLNVTTREEIWRPALVGLQHRAQCQIFSPLMLDERQPPEFEKPGLAYAA